MANLIRVRIKSHVHDQVPDVSFTGDSLHLHRASQSVVEFDAPGGRLFATAMGGSTVYFRIDGYSAVSVEGIFTVSGASVISTVNKGESWQPADTPGSTWLDGTKVSGRALRVNGNYDVIEFEWRNTEFHRMVIASAAFHPLYGAKPG
jgi:hypothetical protein